jgi:hypothetical protein
LFVLTNFFINQSGILLPDDCVANISLLFKSVFSDFDVDGRGSAGIDGNPDAIDEAAGIDGNLDAIEEPVNPKL